MTLINEYISHQDLKTSSAEDQNCISSTDSYMQDQSLGSGEI